MTLQAFRALAIAILLGAALSATAQNTATIPVARDSESWVARNQAMQDRLKQGNADLLWIGDSIVQRWEKDGKPTWKKYYAHRDAVNLGISGDNTEHVLWRIDHYDLGNVEPRLAIVMIGQNNGPTNTAEEIAEGVQAIVTRLHDRLPDTKVLVLGITLRGEGTNEEQPKLARVNEILAKLDNGTDTTVLNINPTFLAPDGTVLKSLMPDFEHPNAAGCKAWAEAIEPTVAKLLGDTPIKP